MEVFIFFIILGIAFVIGGSILFARKDPGKSILLNRMPDVQNMPREQAKIITHRIAIIVIILGVVIMVVGVAGLCVSQGYFS